eukprot:scaffold33264_cov50-Phaeocystis_antarctica.AAC.1
MHLSSELCRCRQSEIASSASLRESRCVMRHASQRRAPPLQAERDRRAVHPTRVGVMQASEQRALPSQARSGKRAAHPYARVGELHTLRASGRDAACISAASQQQALPSQAGRSKRAAHPTRVGVMRYFMRRALPSQAGVASRATYASRRGASI